MTKLTRTPVYENGRLLGSVVVRKEDPERIGEGVSLIRKIQLEIAETFKDGMRFNQKVKKSLDSRC